VSQEGNHHKLPYEKIAAMSFKENLFDEENLSLGLKTGAFSLHWLKNLK
jgi:hypothetical protein